MKKPNAKDTKYWAETDEPKFLSYQYMADLENYADEILKQNKELREAWAKVNGMEAWIGDPETKRLFISVKNEALKTKP